MKTNGYHLYQHSLTTPLTRPLGEQLSAITRHRDKMQKRLNNLLKLPHVGAGDNRMGARTALVEERIMNIQARLTMDNFKITSIQSKMKTYCRNEAGFEVPVISQFNRQAVIRERKVHADKGRILYSANGRYDADEHTGQVPSRLKFITNPLIPSVKEETDVQVKDSALPLA